MNAVPVVPSVRLLRDPGHCLALGFGSGLARRAPGTWGSVVGIALAAGLLSMPGVLYGGLVLGSFVLGVWLCARTARTLGSHDHGAIVFDEIVGVLLTVSFCSSGWIGLAVGFCAFRIFDIVKPWPIRWVDRHVQGGLGIMLDDVLAAVFAALSLEIFEYLSFGYMIFQ